MGLVTCQDCQMQVSDRASACPACGGPMKAGDSSTASHQDAPARPSSGGGLILVGLVMAALAVGAIYLVAKPATGDEAALRAAVTAQFRDPETAEFRGIRWLTEEAACGEVNGTNGFGGKVGYQPFYASFSPARGRFEVFLAGNTDVETGLVAAQCGKR